MTDHIETLKALVEAGDKATQGAWEYIYDPSDPDAIHSFVQKNGGLGVEPVICRITNSSSGKPLTLEDLSNGTFITQAANARQALKSVVDDYERMRGKLEQLSI